MARDVEGPIQKAIVDYLRLAFPAPQIVHHCRNEINKRGVAMARELATARSRGVVKGFPDIIVLPFSTVGPLFFEVKAPGAYPRKEQREVHEFLSSLGYRVAVVRSIDDVAKSLSEWGFSQHIGVKI